MQLQTRSRTLAAVAAGTLLLAPLSGCGADAKKNAAAGSTSTPTSTATAPGENAGNYDQIHGTVVDPTTFITSVIAKMQAERTAHMVINIGSSMTADAEVRYGGATAMRMTMTTGGQTMKALLLGGTVYVQTPPSTKYIKIDKNTPGAGAIIGSFTGLSPTQSVSALKGAIKKVLKFGTVTIGGQQLTKYALTVDTAAITKQFGQNLTGTKLPKTVTYSMYLDSDNLLRRIEMDVSGQKVTMTVDQWGAPFTFSAPPASQIVKQ
jgi:hypothetical protein